MFGWFKRRRAEPLPDPVEVAEPGPEPERPVVQEAPVLSRATPVQQKIDVLWARLHEIRARRN